jgi:hypothetical protein
MLQGCGRDVRLSESKATTFVTLHLEKQLKWNRTKSVAQTVCFFLYLIFHATSLLFDTKPPQLNKFFEPLSVFLGLFSKLFLHNIWNERLSETFLERCKQPEVRWCQIWAVCPVWSNLISDVLWPLKWQHQCGVPRYHVEDALAFFRRTRLIHYFSLFRVFM